ncbi:hypothetical protein EON64_10585 [archaeon]|nr:MAG: hypothetical protein EON64_10585 [archaeon]
MTRPALVATQSVETIDSAQDGSVAYHVMSADLVLQHFKTDRDSGLAETEASCRLAKHGFNILPSAPPKTIWQRLWAQINSTIIYVLLAGAALCFGFDHPVDGVVILVVVVVNVGMGYYMEDKAESTTQKLKALMSPTAWVLRSHEKREADAYSLVPGDIFFLQAGDIVPADARIVSCSDLAVDEAALTGEARAVQKSSSPLPSATVPLAERRCLVFAGTQVIKGSAVCVAIFTGAQCEVGRISALLRDVQETKTPLVQRLEQFGSYVSAGILVLAAIALVVALLRGYSLDQAFAFAIGIAVAAIPEGLPSCVTIIFAVGVRIMAKHRAIVKSLPSVETLGSVSVICSDKTGTLTQNLMTIKALVTDQAIYKVGMYGLLG